jgi:hypothetical protein
MNCLPLGNGFSCMGHERHVDHVQLMKERKPACVGRRLTSQIQKYWGSFSRIGLQSIDKMRVGLLDTVNLMNPAQHQLGQGILV